MDVGVESASEASVRSSSAQRQFLVCPIVLPTGWKRGSFGDEVDDGPEAGAEGWTRKVSRSTIA